jgi:hypothetical protein
MGGFLLEQLGPSALGLFGALILVWVVFYVWRRLIVHPAPPLPDRSEEEMSPEFT